MELSSDESIVRRVERVQPIHSKKPGRPSDKDLKNRTKKVAKKWPSMFLMEKANNS